MLTGALASSYYGRPRTTLDVDIVVQVTEEGLAQLAEVLRSASLKAQDTGLRKAWRSQYRIITLEDRRSPHTLDIILTDKRLERKGGSILGLRTYYQTPRSLILAKLRMIKATLQPEKAGTDREDIRAILKSTRLRFDILRREAKSQSTYKILQGLMGE
jgi:hypothetical protein